MRTSPVGVQLIRHFEGFSPTPYRCPGGYETIGYGHVMLPGEEWGAISKTEAEALLRQDIAEAELALRRFIVVPVEDTQWDALASFVFNLGSGALERSTLRRRVNRGAHLAAAAEFHRWVWAGGRKLPGLIRRRAAEAELYLEGKPTAIE